MFDDWNDLFVTKISLAIHVRPNTGAAHHTDRPFHGLVFNGKGNRNKYVFSDGLVMHTGENCLFYLPKNTTYHVVNESEGEGCWAVNFDLAREICVAPFAVKIQNPDRVLSDFKKAVSAFRGATSPDNLPILQSLYDLFSILKKEDQKQYAPSEKMNRIRPALDRIETDCFVCDLTVEDLAASCGISVAYFRRIFTAEFGVSPKEYILRRRTEYAEKLLLSKQFAVNEVAQMCGFGDPCHFSRAFSKRTGVSPCRFTGET